MDKVKMLIDIPAYLKADLKVLAAEDDRSLTGYVTRILKTHVEEHNAKLIGDHNFRPPGLQEV